MSTHKHKAGHQDGPPPRPAETPEGAEQMQHSPLSGDATDDMQVRWRRKETPGAAQSSVDDGVQTSVEGGGETAVGAGDGQARLEAEQARGDEYFAKWQRTAADMANMRRRHEQERQEYMRQANAVLIADLLPVLDSFDRALALIPDDLREEKWTSGVALVERQLRSVLERAGLQAIEAQGKPFDPNEHEALMQESSDAPEDTVIGELQRGYKLHDRVLRPAMVKVAKK